MKREGHEPADKLSVLVLTASVAGGHQAVAQAISAELEERGHNVLIVDGLALMGRRFEQFITQGYSFQMLRAPRLWQFNCFLCGMPPVAAAIRSLCGALFGRRLLRRVRETEPDVIVSTYLLVGDALGYFTKRWELTTPVIAVDADFGVHPLTVSPHVATHAYPSNGSAEVARRLGGVARAVQLPLPSQYADRPPSPTAARRKLDLAEDAFVVLIVGGTMGIGDLEGATSCALEAGALPIIVTGRNELLHRRLTERFVGTQTRVLGWSDDLPALMTAADCLIQNAGGMTCIEAIALGLPIVMYRPVPGHGRRNARRMMEAGVAVTAGRPGDLVGLLRAAMVDGRFLRRPTPEADALPFAELVESLVECRDRLPLAERPDVVSAAD